MRSADSSRSWERIGAFAENHEVVAIAEDAAANKPPLSREKRADASLPQPLPRKGRQKRNYTKVSKYWSGRRDSNPRPQPWQGCALPLSYARSGARRRSNINLQPTFTISPPQTPLARSSKHDKTKLSNHIYPTSLKNSKKSWLSTPLTHIRGESHAVRITPHKPESTTHCNRRNSAKTERKKKNGHNSPKRRRTARPRGIQKNSRRTVNVRLSHTRLLGRMV